MKFRRAEILAAAVLLFVSASPVMATIHFKDGGIHDIDYQINDDVWVDYESPGLQTTLNILGGAYMPYGYYLKGWEDSIINILGGSIDSRLYAYDSSQVTLSGGKVFGNFRAYDSSQVTVSGCWMGHLDAYSDSQVTVSGGNVHELGAYDSSQVAVSGGSVNLVGRGSSQVVVSGGGSIHSSLCYAYDSSQLTVSGGSMLRLDAYDSSQVTVSGGSVGSLRSWSGGLSAFDSSQVTVSGGSMLRLYAFDSSQVTVCGGLFEGELWVSGNAVLTIDGWDFAVDGAPVGYTELYSIFGGSYLDEPYRQLTGTLLSGDPINNGFRIGNSGKIVLVPEPATILLLGLGGLALLRRRRHEVF